MKIFVTGASSGIGRRIVEFLIPEGHELICLSRRKNFTIKDATVIKGDLRDPSTFGSYLKSIDMIIHAAGITHTDHAGLYMRINFEATRDIISLAEDSGAERFVFISTRAIGSEGGAYSLSKSLAERSLRSSSLDWVILRVAEVYGTQKEEGINLLMRLVLTSKIIPIMGKGEYKITPVYVDDVADAVLKVTRCQEIKREVYTICGPKTYSLNDFVSLLCQFYSVRRIRIPIPLFLIKIAVHLKQYLPLPLHITKDQISRLRMPKDSDFSAAERDFGFSPSSVESRLRIRPLVVS